MNDTVSVLVAQNPEKKVWLLFQDEAGFGRINKPKNYAILQYRMHAGVPESAAVNIPG